MKQRVPGSKDDVRVLDVAYAPSSAVSRSRSVCPTSLSVIHGNNQMSRNPVTCVLLVLVLAAPLLAPAVAWSMPEFARRYNLSCSVCHDAFPRLNAFGQNFADMNYKLPNWRTANTLDLGDERLALPERPPFAVRMQAYVQARDGEEIDPITGFTGNDSDFDFQAPYLIKLLSSAPLSDDITYYFYGIFAEKGGNGETLIEDAWFRHADLFGSGVGM